VKLGSLLVANRGEIACRIMRTARRMGIRTIAVYSDADARAMHVAMADAAVRLGPPPARESYLNAQAILAAARETGADAIHPGYGFLAENADFAEACARADLIFVGPPPDAIRAMGLKDRAKALMAKAGVPIVPGYHGERQEPPHLAAAAARIGFPVLIKAVAGGGGKGMRRVDDVAQFEKALAGAKREAASAFGDDRVLIERLVSRPRHVEVQIFADDHGNAVHLFERDCSLQRRHQKVVEEAPAPGMSAAMRATMGEAGVKAALAVGYCGAGTVEFIADATDGLRADRFWFMEMNTRLQVEHPVTEMVTGLDLVEWQLRVAAGEKLPRTQETLSINGHAVEARLYAEDPQKGFLPSTGRLVRLRLPRDDAHIRVDTGVAEGDEVTMFYDPMIAKIVAWDETRERAAARLAAAIATVEVAGVRTNASFLIALLRQPDFVAGDVDTGLIDRERDALVPARGLPEPRVLALAALLIVADRTLRGKASCDPWDAKDGFRLTGPAQEVLEFQSDEAYAPVCVFHERGALRLEAGGESFTADMDLEPNGSFSAALNGVRFSGAGLFLSGSLALMTGGHCHMLALRDPFASADEAGAAASGVAAPMPGKIVQIFVKPGDRVARGQALAVLEAMKMEHTLAAPAEAVVEAVSASPGDQVVEGAVVVRFSATA